MAGLDERTLHADDDLPEAPEDQEATAVLLVADADGARRAAILTSLRGLDAYVGPALPWDEGDPPISGRCARHLGLATGGGPCDTDHHLTTLVVAADPTALADLRPGLAPLAAVRESSAQRLVESLRAWRLHPGRRDFAAALHVHPGTVRYRVIRGPYGIPLDDPTSVDAIVIALSTSPPGRTG